MEKLDSKKEDKGNEVKEDKEEEKKEEKFDPFLGNSYTKYSIK